MAALLFFPRGIFGWAIRVGLCSLAVLVDAHAVVDRVVERTYSTHGPTTLHVETFYGPIKISIGTKPEIHLLVRETLDAATDEEADRQLRDLSLQIQEVAPGLISAKAEFRKLVHWSWEKWPPMGLSWEIEIPINTSVRLVSRDGALTVPDLRGDVETRAQNGEIFIGNVVGAVRAWSGQGNVTLASATGHVEVTARSGNVLVGRVGSSAEIAGAGGSIEVQSSHGQLRVDGDGADLKVGFVYPLHGDGDLRAGGGDATVSFESNLSAQVDARASTFGQVKVRALTFTSKTGQSGDSHLTGVLGSGGPKISIRAAGGSVRLLGVPAS